MIFTPTILNLLVSSIEILAFLLILFELSGNSVYLHPQTSASSCCPGDILVSLHGFSTNFAKTTPYHNIPSPKNPTIVPSEVET